MLVGSFHTEPNLKTIYVYSAVCFQNNIAIATYIKLSFNTHKQSGRAHSSSYCMDDQIGLKDLTGPKSLSNQWST